jgi:hypothetical protein
MKLGKLIRTGGLALALAAGTLAGGCDDDDPTPAKDGSATTDAGGDAGKTDTGTVTPDAGTDTATAVDTKADTATDTAPSDDATPATDTGSDDSGSDASAD